MKEVKLQNCSLTVIVSDEDFEIVSAHKWYKRKDGYTHAKINNKSVLMHRHIFLNLMNEHLNESYIVDHKDQNKANNSRDNLRSASRSENALNKSKSDQNASSSFIGVNKSGSRWETNIIINGVRFREYYDNELHAAYALNLILEEQKCQFKNRNSIDKKDIISFERYQQTVVVKKCGRNGEVLPRGICFKNNKYYVSAQGTCTKFDMLEDAHQFLKKKTQKLKRFDNLGRCVIELFDNHKTKVCETIVDEGMFAKLSEYSWNFDKTTGYIKARVQDKTVRLHRFVLNYYGNDVVDHINGNPLDNRVSNLRIVTAQENCKNTSSRKNSSSKYLGVSYCNRDNNWTAQITIDNGKRITKTFKSEIDAARYRDLMTKTYYGTVGRLNFNE